MDEDIMFLRVVRTGLICGTIFLCSMVGTCQYLGHEDAISLREERKAAMEAGYEMVVAPGSADPIWVKVREEPSK